jgi:hypothetical protein
MAGADGRALTSRLFCRSGFGYLVTGFTVHDGDGAHDKEHNWKQVVSSLDYGDRQTCFWLLWDERRSFGMKLDGLG